MIAIKTSIIRYKWVLFAVSFVWFHLLVFLRFSLDEETGWVILRASLDYELMRRFTLTVLARDGGGEETTGRIRVNVVDVNDNVPLFQKEAYVGSLRENEQAVQPVARVRVCVKHALIFWTALSVVGFVFVVQHNQTLHIPFGNADCQRWIHIHIYADNKEKK